MPVEPNGGMGDGAPSIGHALVQAIEKAHHKKEFMEHKAVSFDLEVKFGGKERIAGNLTMLTNSGKVRIEKSNGESLIFDGSSTYITPEDADASGARFDTFTWAYFFSFPYKLSDPGTLVTPMQNDSLMGKSYTTFKLEFDQDTGDSPKDWYVGYLNKNNQVRAAAYIVTFNKSLDKAEASPHAIMYSGYKEIDGIPIAHHWEFYNWNKEQGITGAPIGMASINNLKFLSPDDGFFSRPEKAKVTD